MSYKKKDYVKHQKMMNLVKEYKCTTVCSPKLTFGEIYTPNPRTGQFYYDDGTVGNMVDCMALFKEVK